MRKRDLNKNGAVIFHRKQHQLLAEMLHHFRFREEEITSQEGGVRNGLVRILHWQVEMIEAAEQANAIQKLQKTELLEDNP